MKKKVLAALLVGMMSVSLLAGCSTGMENDASSSAPSGAAVNSESNVSSGSGSEGSGESTGTGGGARPHRPSPCACRGPSCGAAGYAGQARGGTGKSVRTGAGQARCITARSKARRADESCAPAQAGGVQQGRPDNTGEKGRFS